MKKLLLLLSGFLLLIIIAGCTSVKRYKSATWVGEDNSLVDMDLFGARLSPQGSEVMEKSLWDLSAGAQTQLIQILDERYPDNVQFMSSLSNPYMSENSIGSLDLTKKDLKMVFTIQKRRDYTTLAQSSSRFSPADRIEYVDFSLLLPSEYNLSFTRWNRYSTEYGEIEVADVSFSASLDLNADGQIRGADAGGKTGISRNEKQEVRSRYLKFNGSINQKSISMVEEGNREIDLTGNIVADVSLEFEGFPERLVIPVFTGKSGEETGIPEVAMLRFVDVLVPRMKEAPDTLFAMLKLEYVYRHVQSGWKTFAEWDDRVEYYTGNIEKKVPLFVKKDFLPSFYCIGRDYPDRQAVKFMKGVGEEYLLQFKDYEDANRFLEWLEMELTDSSAAPLSVGNIKLLFGEDPLTPKLLEGVNWKIMPVF